MDGKRKRTQILCSFVGVPGDEDPRGRTDGRRRDAEAKTFCVLQNPASSELEGASQATPTPPMADGEAEAVTGRARRQEK